MPFYLSIEKQRANFFSMDNSLTIYDGGSNTSPIMGKYCNSNYGYIPPSHSSSTNELLIHLQFISYSEFEIEYNLAGEQNTMIPYKTKFH